MKVKVISLPYISQVLYVLCYGRPRYQVSVYRTIGPLVSNKFSFIDFLRFHRNFAFFNPFSAPQEAPNEIHNCFYSLLQLYNVDMTFQNNFDTINFNL